MSVKAYLAILLSLCVLFSAPMAGWSGAVEIGALDKNLRAWALDIRSKITRRLYAAPTVEGRHRVVAQFFVDRMGHVSRLAIQTSSGNAAIDAFVLRNIARLAPFPPVPANDTSAGHMIVAPITLLSQPARSSHRRPGSSGATR